MLEKVFEAIEELYLKYKEDFGMDFEFDLDILTKFFDDLECTIESKGGKVIEKYIAPNGHIVFEFDGKKHVFDLSYGFFTSEDD